MQHPELMWLTLTVLLTLFLAPISAIRRVVENGLNDALTSKKAIVNPPEAEWGKRAMRAHGNAVENLVIFAPLVIILHIQGISAPITTMIYFIARIIHAGAYIAGISPLRGFSFMAGTICLIRLGVMILMG